MAIYAEAIINSVRDQIPDPVYDASGNALPSTDGNLVRVQTLLRWIDEAVQVCAEQCGWLVEDWYALAATTNQPVYDLDPKWQRVDTVWYKQYQLGKFDETMQMLPSRLTGDQPTYWSFHKRSDHLEIRILPAPDPGDPQTTLTDTINSNLETVTVGSTASFNSYGYFKVLDTANGDEIFSYNTVSENTTLLQVRNAQSGTASANHNPNRVVQHLGLWLKGARVPTRITTATGINGLVELPQAFVYPVQLYVLSKVRNLENDYQEARALMGDFEKTVGRIKADPSWKDRQGFQVAAYGETTYGPLAWGRVIIT